MSDGEVEQRNAFSEGVDDEAEAELLSQELSEVPLGELQELRQKLGTKKFDSLLKQAKEERKTERSFKRANKNRPREMSSKRPVSRFREVVVVGGPKRASASSQSVDPRFDERAGSLNEDLFKKSYAFVEEMKQSEKNAIEKAVKKTKSKERKEQLQRLIDQMESRKMAAEKKEQQQKLLREHRKEAATLGKKPYYIKKSVQKRAELALKYKELKRSGKLETFLTKKRKKNASRDRKHLPFKQKS